MDSKGKMNKKDIREELLEITTNLGQVLECNDIVINIDKKSYKRLIRGLDEYSENMLQKFYINTPFGKVEIKAADNFSNDVESFSSVPTSKTIKNMTEPERVFLILYYYENKNYQEISSIMNYPVHYVKEVHNRILNSLKQSYWLIDNLAKYMADKIGHGMREKCYDHAKFAIDFFMDKNV